MQSTAAPAPLELLISIINYRTAEMTIDCLASVLTDLGNLNAHVAVVDNLSDDGSAEIIAAWIAEQGAGTPVTLIRSATNAGFSGGHNQGIQSRPAAFYLVLNSDALLRPGCLAALLAAARAHPGAGLIAPRLEDPDGTPQNSCFRFPSPISELLRAAKTGPVSRLFSAWEIATGPDPAPSAIEWASFACILLRHEMVEAIGQMDEGYFLYFEDCEYSLRARRAGWPIHRAPEARCVHLRGGSAPVKRLAAEAKRLPAYYYASRTRFLRQAYGRAGPLGANLLWHLGRVIARVRPLLGGRVPPANAAEARDIWINFLDPLGPRRAPWETAGRP